MRARAPQPRPKQSAPAERVFLFLQGPHSPFFAKLGRRLREEGHRVHRINLCAGDWLFWAGRDACHYRGSFKDWPLFLQRFVVRRGVTDVVLLGEQRPFHREAVKLAKRRNLQVTVTEWGYLRPDWITFEKEGMSGNTRFPRSPKALLRIAKDLPSPDFGMRYRDSFARMAASGFCADLLTWLCGFLYPGYRSPLLNNPLTLYCATGWHCATSFARRRSAKEFVHRLAASAREKPYFVFPMQIEADYQIRAYSEFNNLEEALRRIIGSFAGHAPEGCRLVVKVHPLDPFLRPWPRVIRGMAQRHSAEDRVLFVDGGSFEELCSAASGVVTINSTCGVSAIKLGKPVIALGEALFDVPGLTFQGSLEDFWGSPTSPDPGLAKSFVRAVAACIQIKGGFFSKEGLEAAVSGAASRLLQGKLNHPVRHAEAHGRRRPEENCLAATEMVPVHA